jgi:hypothetical protein
MAVASLPLMGSIGVTVAGSMTTREKLDEQTLKTCTHAKNAGVLIFAVGYGVVSGSYAESLLKNCSGGFKRHHCYFSVSDEGSLDAAFNNIRDQLTYLRLWG